MTRPQPPAFPANPWTPTFLMVAVVAGVIVSAIVSSKRVPVGAVSVVITLAAALLAVLAWNRFSAARTRTEAAPVPSGTLPYLLLVVSFAVAAYGLFRQYNSTGEWIALVAPYLLIVLYQAWLSPSRMMLLIVAPLLFGLLFLDSAALMGRIAGGGYPAVLAVLLTFIVHVTRDLERRTQVPEEDGGDPHVHLIHRKPLAWLSVAFFLFGVVSFWPWLGRIYGHIYFGVLVIGVLSPALYLWGRLRQPRRQNSYMALLRFNRLIPYFGLVLLLAIALG